MRSFRLLRTLGLVTMLTLPLVVMQGGAGALGSEQRKRLPAPTFARAGRGYPEQFDAFFRDNFGLREPMIRWHNLLKFKYFRESPVKRVVVGSDGWLFYAGLEDGIDIRDFAGRWPYRPSLVDEWLQHQELRRAEYDRMGARYLIVLVPNKQTMYPEAVPRRFGPHAPGVLDTLLRRAEYFQDLEILDLRQVLRSHLNERVFYRADSHWNSNGAFYAAQAIIERVRPWLPAVGSMTREDYTVTENAIDSGDLANMLSLGLAFDDYAFAYHRTKDGARLVEEDEAHDVWEQPGARLPRAVLLGDSFGVRLGPLLADAFARLHYRHTTRVGYDDKLIERERPDLVILVLVERYLEQLASH